MTAQGLEVIEHTVHTTHEWINELSGRLDYASKRSALRLLRTVLHHVRDHLVIDELAQFSAQLPLLIRGMMFEEWVPKHTPIKERKVGDFDDYFRTQMWDTDEFRGRADVIKVFELLNARISVGEVNDIRSSLPAAIREIWPTP